MNDDDEIIREFLVESYESLNQLDQDLVELEERPDDNDLLSRIFRSVHTVKGTSGFLAFATLERVAHVGENLLVSLRDGELRVTEGITSGLLKLIDAIREILGRIEATAQEGDEQYEELVALLTKLRTGEDAGEPAAEAVPETAPAADAVAEDVAHGAEASAPAAPAAEATAAPADPTPPAPMTASPPPVKAAAPVTSKKSDDSPASGATETSAQSDGHASVAETTVRIEVDLLDKLMNMVGELVLARNQVLQYVGDAEDTGLAAASQRLSHVTAELQEGVMKTRMQPIRNVWGRMPRVVRDLARDCGKSVRVVSEGGDTELDKTILEAIKDPLTHIVRNAVDHGIEAPEQRSEVGKPTEGELALRAWHEGGQVNIEIRDDGRGLDLERIRAKAVEKGLVTAETAAATPDREAIQFILLPGFSTAEKVTNVSGRGVGMDVVKTNVEKIGGTLELSSEFGKGTTLRIRIPLTLAIVPAMIVSSDGQRYCIPQVGLRELVRLERGQGERWIEHVHSAPVYRLRDRLLPLVYLDEVLGSRPARTSEERVDADAINIVVLEAEGRPFGLVVESIDDTQEIVVKGLSGKLQSIDLYAGATIVGDGSVVLILDACGLARSTSVLRDTARAGVKHEEVVSESGRPLVESLLVESGDGGRVAVPLDSVQRLEEFGLKDVQQLGNRAVVMYRGSVMPVIPVGQFAGEKAERRPVVVTRSEGVEVGYVVRSIIDVVSHEAFESVDGLQIIDGQVTRSLASFGGSRL